MSRKPLTLALGIVCAAVGGGVVTPRPAPAQITPERPYFGRTILWGSGMIVTPTAAVPPGKVNVSATGGTYFTPDGGGTNPAGVVTLGILGVFEGGVSIYSDEDAAGFAKLQIIRGNPRFPSLAVGVLNLTGRDLGRFGNEDPFYDEFKNRTVGYGVFTYTVEPGEESKPIWLEVSAGWGSGFLSEANPAFDTELWGKGAFASFAFDFKVGRDHFVRLMAEYDSWNVNVGAMVMAGGVEVSGGVLAVDGRHEEEARQEERIRGYLAVTIDWTAGKRWPLIWKRRS